jgi:F-type H+-transporting ATPase subunit gamma
MTLEQTQRHRKAVGTIHDIVSAMRAIAAGRIQAAQRAVASSRRYEDVVLRGILAVRPAMAQPAVFPTSHGPTLVLVLTSEQPFCGAFNTDLLALAEQRLRVLRQQAETRLIVLGHRGAAHLAARGLVPDVTLAAATSVRGLRDVVKQLAELVDQRFAAGQLGALRAIYNQYRSITQQVPTDELILPVDASTLAPTTPPVAQAYGRQLSDAALIAGLVSQYAYIRLYRIAADSFASEQASRLTAMDGATRNTEKMLDALIDLERRERQGEITRQVLELVSSRFAHD